MPGADGATGPAGPQGPQGEPGVVGPIVDIDGGTIDETVIGGAIPAAGSFAAVVGTTGVFGGILKTDDVTNATSGTDGSLQTDGGLSVLKDIFSEGNTLTISSPNTGGTNYANIVNSAQSGASSAAFLFQVEGAGTGDPYIRFGVAGGETVVFGLDNSATNDLITLSHGSAIGSDVIFTIDPTTGDTWQLGGADFNGTVDLNANSLENVGNANTDITGTGADFGVPISSTYTADDYWTLEKSDSGPWASQVFGAQSTGTSTPAAFIDVAVPNPTSTTRNVYASIVIDYMVSTVSAAGGGDVVYAGRAVSVIERGGDSDTATSTVTKLDTEVVAGSGGETIDIGFDYSAVTGATTGTQTLSIRVTADSSLGLTASIVYDAKVITYNSGHGESGLRVAIAPSA